MDNVIVEITSLPDSVTSFSALQAQIAQTPEGGAALFALALLLFSETPDLGAPCLALAAAPERRAARDLGAPLSKRDQQFVISQLRDRAYLPRSYFQETSPENGYALPSLPYRCEISTNPYSGDPVQGVYKVFLQCSGADRPRPVTVKRDAAGLWHASEWSSLLSGIRPPVELLDA